MQRNKEKNKRIRQTVRQCDSFTEISDAKLVFSCLVLMCFPDAGSVFSMCVPGNDDVPRSGGFLIKTILPKSIAFDYGESGEIPWGCHSEMNIAKSWEDELVNT